MMMITRMKKRTGLKRGGFIPSSEKPADVPFFFLGLLLDDCFFLVRLLRLFDPSETETLFMLPSSKSLSTSGSSSSL